MTDMKKAEKAKITVETQSGEVTIPVMYNPNEYTISAEATFDEKAPNPKFTKVKFQDFTVTLFFDTYYEQSDVRDKTKEIAQLLWPSVSGKESKNPAICKFIWGKAIYEGYVTKVDQKFTMFLSNGLPVRAELTITFKSVMTQEELKKSLGISKSRKYWTVKSGDRLDLIAQQMLGDKNLWRIIAKYNKIEDTIAFPKDEIIGSVLLIPDYYHMKGEL